MLQAWGWVQTPPGRYARWSQYAGDCCSPFAQTRLNATPVAREQMS